jgi:hypothetical protein
MSPGRFRWFPDWQETRYARNTTVILRGKYFQRLDYWFWTIDPVDGARERTDMDRRNEFYEIIVFLCFILYRRSPSTSTLHVIVKRYE